jgi:hypothetical protein
MEFYGVLMPILWPFTAKMGFKYQTCSGTKAHWHVPSRQDLLFWLRNISLLAVNS